jgi:hypothetical protein
MISIGTSDLPFRFSGPDVVETTLAEVPLREAKRDFERAYFRDLLRRVRGNVSLGSRRSGVPRPYLYRKLNQHNLDPNDFRDKGPPPKKTVIPINDRRVKVLGMCKTKAISVQLRLDDGRTITGQIADIDLVSHQVSVIQDNRPVSRDNQPEFTLVTLEQIESVA